MNGTEPKVPQTKPPRISVGIPVYNGEPFLAEALACLSRQDAADAEFIICDNASTDATAAIAAEYAARDPRFRIITQSATKPGDENFSDVLHQACGEFFCWRAADDLSSDNFLSELARLLDAHPRCMLATCRVDNIRGRDPAIMRSRPLPAGPGLPRPGWHAMALMQSLRAAAIYGLWRRADIVKLHAEARARFPYLVAQDVLILLHPLLQGRVATTNSVTFVQRLKDKSSSMATYVINDPAMQAHVRSRFRALALEQWRAVEAPPLRKLAWWLATELYVERRVFRLWRIWLGRIGRRRDRGTVLTRSS
jgi:glycosyltransferase involved in cell wall biosynthesis